MAEESVNTTSETVTSTIYNVPRPSLTCPQVTVNDQPSDDYDHPPPPTPIYRKDQQKVIELKEASKSPAGVRTPGKPVKFPLLSKNYVIHESTDMESNSEGIYDNVRINKAKSPLEVFTFPDPPKERPPEHYLVTDTNGVQSEYARPESYKGPKILAPDFVPKVKPILPKNPTLIPQNKKTLSEINFNPYDQMYSVLSSSR